MICFRPQSQEGSQTLTLWLRGLSWSSLLHKVSQQPCGRRKEGRRTDGWTDGQREAESRPREGGCTGGAPCPPPQLPHPGVSLCKPDGEVAAQVPRESPPRGWTGLAPPEASKVRPKILTLSSTQPSCTGQRPAVQLTPSGPGLGRSSGDHLCVLALPSMPARPFGDPGDPRRPHPSRGLVRGWALHAGGHSVGAAEGQAASGWLSKVIHSPPHDFLNTYTPLN